MSEIDRRIAEMVRANRLGISITELRRRTAEDREAGKRAAEAYRAALNGALAKPPQCRGMNWQDIETAPMEDGDEYLVWDGLNVSLVNVYHRNWWCLAEFTIDAPTHWMPLPTPPTVAEGE